MIKTLKVWSCLTVLECCWYGEALKNAHVNCEEVAAPKAVSFSTVEEKKILITKRRSLNWYLCFWYLIGQCLLIGSVLVMLSFLHVTFLYLCKTDLYLRQSLARVVWQCPPSKPFHLGDTVSVTWIYNIWHCWIFCLGFSVT